MIRLAAFVLALMLLAGCKTVRVPEPKVTAVEVAVPVARLGCVPANMSPKPQYPDTDAALKGAPDAASRYQLLYAGRKLRNARLDEIEPVVASCPKAEAK